MAVSTGRHPWSPVTATAHSCPSNWDERNSTSSRSSSPPRFEWERNVAHGWDTRLRQREEATGTSLRGHCVAIPSSFRERHAVNYPDHSHCSRNNFRGRLSPEPCGSRALRAVLIFMTFPDGRHGSESHATKILSLWALLCTRRRRAAFFGLLQVITGARLMLSPPQRTPVVIRDEKW